MADHLQTTSPGTAPANGSLPATEPAKAKKRSNGDLLQEILSKVQPAQPTKIDFSTVQGFNALQREALAFSSSSIVPEKYQGPTGSSGHANCMIALDMAHRTGMPELLVMQNLTLVDGKPGWQGKFLAALINASGRYLPLKWEETSPHEQGKSYDDDYGVRCVVTRKEDGEVCKGTWITVRMCKAEGWWSKKSREGKECSKWQSMPDQMFVYRSTSFWVNQFCPEITLGIRTADELEDMAPADRPAMVAPQPQTAPAPAPAAVAQPAPAEADPEEPSAVPEPTQEDPKLAEIERLLQAGNRREALAAVQRLPKELQKAGTALYNLHWSAR